MVELRWYTNVRDGTLFYQVKNSIFVVHQFCQLTYFGGYRSRYKLNTFFLILYFKPVYHPAQVSGILMVQSMLYKLWMHSCKIICIWGEPERAPHWLVVEVYVGASRCAQSVNNRKAIQVLYTLERHFLHGV